MKLIKTILINLLIVVLLLMASASVYFANYKGLPVFADSVPSGYSPVTSDDELAQSFNDYCKSRDAEFTSTMPGATYTYIYNYMKKGANYLGYDIDSIQEGLYKSYTASGTIGKWYMTTQTIDFYNRLFAYLINENDLQVGDSANVNLYSGLAYTDYDGNTCLIYVSRSNVPSNDSFTNNLYDDAVSNFSSLGTPYKYTSEDIGRMFYNSENPYFRTSASNTINRTLNLRNADYLVSDSKFKPSGQTFGLFGTVNNYVSDGYYCVCRFANYTDRLYLCSWTSRTAPNGEVRCDFAKYLILQTSSDFATNNLNINFVTIDNKTINNNTYEGDTIINNNGTVEHKDPVYNPYPGGGGTTTPPGSSGGSGSGGTINLPDIDLDLPSINWSLGDLSSKFPFSIPFDLLAFFTVLNAEPETPEIHGTLNLAIINYQFDFDLHDFDDLASLLRNLEFVGFCIGLILITRNMLRV